MNAKFKMPLRAVRSLERVQQLAADGGILYAISTPSSSAPGTKWLVKKVEITNGKWPVKTTLVEDGHSKETVAVNEPFHWGLDPEKLGHVFQLFFATESAADAYRATVLPAAEKKPSAMDRLIKAVAEQDSSARKNRAVKLASEDPRWKMPINLDLAVLDNLKAISIDLETYVSWEGERRVMIRRVKP